jgi:hypothetical protein
MHRQDRKPLPSSNDTKAPLDPPKGFGAQTIPGPATHLQDPNITSSYFQPCMQTSYPHQLNFHQQSLVAPPNFFPPGYQVPMPYQTPFQGIPMAPWTMMPQNVMYHYDTTPNNKRRYGHSDRSTSNSPEMIEEPSIKYPTVESWLQSLIDDSIRGCDNVDYSAFSQPFIKNGILRLDDLTRLTSGDLCNIMDMNIGTATRILEWARCDKQRMDRSTKGRKVARY